MTNIVWLASYPKSGNTWLRMFLAHLLLEEGAAAPDLNDLGRTLHDGLGIASSRNVFDEEAGISASDLLPDEIERLRPRVYEALAARCERPAFVKVHDAFLATPAGEPLLPPAATRAAIYVVRNPLDVAVSYAFHSGRDFDTMIAVMADPEFAAATSATRLSTQLRQRLSSWSGHVSSWIDAAGVNCHMMRYEDMVQNPVETFSATARFLDLPCDEARVKQALDGARFEKLSAQEQERGFVERPRRAERFFRTGRIGDWRNHLDGAQAARITADHREMMRRLGYLRADGSALY
jgi:aryl sulfotransferase